MLSHNVATFQLATSVKNAVKYKLKLGKNGRENQTKMRWVWSQKQNVSEIESRCEALR